MIEDVYKRLGMVIYAYRRHFNWTQAQLAKLVGMTGTNIANIEAGRRRIRLHDVYAFCAAFDVTPHMLLKEVW